MKRQLFLGALVMISLLSSCAYNEYPGQPGMVTNGYSKLDYEFLDFDGLWVYEVSYDNRQGGAGVGAIVTKFYPGSKINTSNIRMNSEGTLYRHKGQYDGATVQAIVIPKLKQIMMPPNNNVWGFIGRYESMNEVDDRNMAEEKIFTQPTRKDTGLSSRFKQAKRFLQILSAGTLKRDGNLHFDVEAVELGDKKYELKEAVNVQTNLIQTSLVANIKPEIKDDFRRFFEGSFAKGFNGEVKVHVKGQEEALSFPVTIHTPTTAKASGYSVIPMRQEELRQVAVRFGVN